MRILHTSDWHLGRNLEHISRIDEQHEFIDCLCKIVEEQDVNMVLVAGDVFDAYTPPAAAEELFYDAMDRLSRGGKRAVIVIAGNHDDPERLCAASPLAYKNGIILLGYPYSDAGAYKNAGAYRTGENINIVDSGPGWLEICLPGFSYHAVIIALPYPSEARLQELLAREADEGILQKAYSEKIGAIFSTLGRKFRGDTVNLAVGHFFLRSGKESESERTLQVGGAMTVDPQVLPSNAHFVAIGHLHRPQQIKEAPCPTFYSGSPLAYSFSEADYSKAVYIIDAVPGEKAKIQELYIDCGKPLRRWVADQGIGQAIRWCEEGRDRNAWVDLEIAADRALTTEEQKRLRDLHPGIINIRPKLKAETVELSNIQGREGRKIEELFRDFYKYRMGLEISDELMGAFIEIVNEQGEETEDVEDVMGGGDGNETEAS